ncbi:hypothetical protein ACRALDRAFT_1064030 [Sodiomyces alcalophilus JCM 7366]|uniref:uncharacterized protein n=1 Tax=Sodiomyces alcalophilus JCM 7366 TaxID=591952 RepID=UPI0039B3EC02
MSSVFTIKGHIIDASHIREFPRGLANSQEDVLQLAVKEYIPKDNPNPQPGDVTILGAHANGFPKELYEALWEDLHAHARRQGFRIRSILIADAAWQGYSGILNEDKLGNDPGWLDHPRDMLHLVNTLRPPRPLVGIGHSFGGNAIANLALSHPRLFTAVVLLDPVISKWSASARGSVSASPAASSARRRDLWPSREAAAASFRRNPFYSAWDPRVLDSWVKHGLRETPTPRYSGETDAGKVTLTTTKDQEVFTYFRPSWNAYDTQGKKLLRPELVPDMDPTLNERYYTFPVYRAEGASTLARLPNMRAPVLYIFGADSELSTPELREEKMRATGVGVGGSGGKAKGKAEEVTLEGRGHLIPMEVPDTCAEHAARWIAKELQVWKAEQAEYEAWAKGSREEKTTLTDEWQRHLGRPERPDSKGKAKI